MLISGQKPDHKGFSRADTDAGLENKLQIARYVGGGIISANQTNLYKVNEYQKYKNDDPLLDTRNCCRVLTQNIL